MRLEQLFERKSENADVKKAPPPGELGKFITVKQAAKICNCTPSRIRQFIMEDRLKTHSPEIGRRDNMLELTAVQAFCKKDRPITGRPEGSKEKKGNKSKKD